MAKTDLTNQRQVFVEEYVSSGDHLEEAKKAEYKDTHTRRFTFLIYFPPSYPPSTLAVFLPSNLCKVSQYIHCPRSNFSKVTV